MKVKSMGRRLSSWIIATAVVFVSIPAAVEVVGVKIAKDETISVGGKAVRHVAGVRLPPVAVPIVRYSSANAEAPKAKPLESAELTRCYGMPDNYRRKVAEVVDRLIQDRFLPESARAKYVADAEKVNWGR